MKNLQRAALKSYTNSKFVRKEMEQHALKNINNSMNANHRHLKNIDCLTVHVFFISTVNGCSKKIKEAYYELR